MAISGKQPLGTILVQAGKIDEDQLQKALQIQKEKDGLTKKLSDLKSKRATLVEDFEFLSKTQDMLFCLSVGTFVGWAATKLFLKE